MTNNIELLNKYDQIYKDLEPYRGMNPKDLQDRDSERSYKLVHTREMADGPISLVNYTLPSEDTVRFDRATGRISHHGAS